MLKGFLRANVADATSSAHALLYGRAEADPLTWEIPDEAPAWVGGPDLPRREPRPEAWSQLLKLPFRLLRAGQLGSGTVGVLPVVGRRAGLIEPELMPPDSNANPYLALDGLNAVGLAVADRGLPPGEDLRVYVDPATLTADRPAASGGRRLPSNLGEANDALENDGVLIDALVPTLASSYLATHE